MSNKAITVRDCFLYASGALFGGLAVYAAMRSMNHETELVITEENARHMFEDDAVGVYETKYGTIFTAMQKPQTALEVLENLTTEEDSS